MVGSILTIVPLVLVVNLGEHTATSKRSLMHYLTYERTPQMRRPANKVKEIRHVADE